MHAQRHAAEIAGDGEGELELDARARADGHRDHRLERAADFVRAQLDHRALVRRVLGRIGIVGELLGRGPGLGEHREGIAIERGLERILELGADIVPGELHAADVLILGQSLARFVADPVEPLGQQVAHLHGHQLYSSRVRIETRGAASLIGLVEDVPACWSSRGSSDKAARVRARRARRCWTDQPPPAAATPKPSKASGHQRLRRRGSRRRPIGGDFTSAKVGGGCGSGDRRAVPEPTADRQSRSPSGRSTAGRGRRGTRRLGRRRLSGCEAA